MFWKLNLKIKIGKKPPLKIGKKASSGQAMNSKTPVVKLKARRRYKCKSCSYACSEQAEMKMHRLVHISKKSYSCKDCEARFTQLGSMKRHHLRVHVKEKTFQCSKCDYAGSTKDNLLAHLSVHKVEKSFSCTECEKAFATVGQLKKHQFVAHAKEKRLKCSSCDYTCAWPSTLKTHQLVHSKKKTLKCDECGKWFSRPSHLIRHNLSDHSTQARLKCAHCKYSCVLKERLGQHLLSHSAKVHSCGKCEARFTTTYNLNRHNVIVHTKKKRFKCSLCNYDSYFKNDLKKHKQCHEKTNSFKRFEILDLTKQLSDDVDTEVFKCRICSSTFDNKPSLKLHILQHTGSTPFLCSICGSSFRVEKSLKQHMANLHQEKT